MLRTVICVYFVLYLVNVAENKIIGPDLKTVKTDRGVIQPKIDVGREKKCVSSTLHENDQYQIGRKHNVDKRNVEIQNPCQNNGTQGGHILLAAGCSGDGLKQIVFDIDSQTFIDQGVRQVQDKLTSLTDEILSKNLSMFVPIEREPGTIQSSITTTTTTTTIAKTPTTAATLTTTSNIKQFLQEKRNKAKKLPQVRGPYNANFDSKYVEFVLVYDNGIFNEMDKNLSKIAEHAKSVVNIMNTIYEPLNIFIALIDVVTWTEQDEIQLSDNGDQTLTNFLAYRRNMLKIRPNDNAHLITTHYFSNGVVGKALKGPICTFEYSGAISTTKGYNSKEQLARGIAHQLGHNFGMEHDTADCECHDPKCIMTASFSNRDIQENQWSSCSKTYLLKALTRGMDYCLRNKPVSLFGGPTYGNGFVESGEQCDCGLPEKCNNTCCDGTTCMLKSNASCATGECCDLNTCQPKNIGTLCRPKSLECDLPEYCDGESEYCPPDTYRLDGDVCADGAAYCYEGSCKTRTDQCQLLWGLSGKDASEKCYSLNLRGSRHGNCGYNQLNQSYTKCESGDIECGLLQCTHLNERLEFGMEAVSILSHTFINSQGSILPCRSAIVDLGTEQIGPGLVPNGAKCGQGKMCINQRCESVAVVTELGVNCPNNCNGNGWCNNEGHCHCKDGFAPPHCILFGLGGSIDSGPASDPKAIRINNETVFNKTEDDTLTTKTTEFENTTTEISPVNINPEGHAATQDLMQSSGCTTKNCTDSQLNTAVDNQSFVLSLAIEVLKAMLPSTNKTKPGY